MKTLISFCSVMMFAGLSFGQATDTSVKGSTDGGGGGGFHINGKYISAAEAGLRVTRDYRSNDLSPNVVREVREIVESLPLLTETSREELISLALAEADTFEIVVEKDRPKFKKFEREYRQIMKNENLEKEKRKKFALFAVSGNRNVKNPKTYLLPTYFDPDTSDRTRAITLLHEGYVRSSKDDSGVARALLLDGLTVDMINREKNTYAKDLYLKMAKFCDALIEIEMCDVNLMLFSYIAHLKYEKLNRSALRLSSLTSSKPIFRMEGDISFDRENVLLSGEIDENFQHFFSSRKIRYEYEGGLSAKIGLEITNITDNNCDNRELGELVIVPYRNRTPSILRKELNIYIAQCQANGIAEIRLNGRFVEPDKQ